MKSTIPSRYNLMFKDIQTGNYFLHNTYHRATIMLDKTEVEFVGSILKGDRREKDEQSVSHKEMVRTLKKMRFLVPDDLDEWQLLVERKLRGINNPNKLDLILLPTLACNLRCVYCFESGHRIMSGEPRWERIHEWLKETVPRFPITEVHWFGGEPTLSSPQVLETTRLIRSLSENAHAKLILSMTTNGFLLPVERVKEFCETGLVNYQVTLDGTRETHDRLRPLAGGGPTFEHIFTNLDECLGSIPEFKLQLRVNFNASNIATISTLLRSFKPGHRSRIKVSFQPIFGDTIHTARIGMSEGSIAESILDFSKEAEQLGYRLVRMYGAKDEINLVNCYAEKNNTYAVLANADVYKCTSIDFTPGDRLGYIDRNGTLVKEPTWDDWTKGVLFSRKCEVCPYAPLCLGGCRKKRKEQDSSVDCTSIPLKELENTLGGVLYEGDLRTGT